MGRGQGQDFGATGVVLPVKRRPTAEAWRAARSSGEVVLDAWGRQSVTVGGATFKPCGPFEYDVAASSWEAAWEADSDFGHDLWGTFDRGDIIDVVGEDGSVKERLEMVLDPEASGGGTFNPLPLPVA